MRLSCIDGTGVGGLTRRTSRYVDSGVHGVPQDGRADVVAAGSEQPSSLIVYEDAVLSSHRERSLPCLSVATVALQQACHPRSSAFRQGGG